jgi:predicted CXXCH cytochrome family protein
MTRRMNSAVCGSLPVVCAALLLSACEDGGEPGSRLPAAAITAPSPAAFVGGAACAGCHADEARAWTGSHHDHAMRVASADTVLGDFDAARFEHGGITSRFFTRDGAFWVNTDGSDGELRDFRITHTFGFEPLQQYLVELPGGRYQALSIAWDTREASQGGQRWFHLYPDEVMASSDPLHWTGRFQSWNTMCAECHSTNLVKAYDLQSDTFATRFTSIDVDCEACHGPGSVHVSDPTVALPALPRSERTWVFADGARIARRSAGSPPNREIEVCAQCHSRRSQLSDDYTPGDPFLQGFRPALLDPGLYYADGQILDEVYVYGSFRQSAMAAAGVTCSDCHEPHSAKLRAQGNALCGQCHLPSAYDTAEHHHHEPGGTGSECVSCHMRSRTYMVVDPRRDHSFRVPRPDLSARLDSPNACGDCHADQTSDWAANRIAAWFPDGRQNAFHYGEALQAGRSWSADGPTLLRRVLADPGQPAIVRATALGLIADPSDAAVLELVRQALADPDPLMRLAGLELLQPLPAAQRIDAAQDFLTDPLLALRIAAARVLVTARDGLDQTRLQQFNSALAEYIAVQEFSSDRGEGLVNLGGLALELGDLSRAESYFLAAIDRVPALSGAYVNLADLYRGQGRETEAQQTLAAGLSINPDDAGLHFALGLSLVRSGQPDAALAALEEAVRHAPDSPYYAYVQGVALNSMGQGERARELLRANHERFPGHRDTLLGLVTMLRDAGAASSALEYARRLAALAPGDPAARALLAELEAASSN